MAGAFWWMVFRRYHNESGTLRFMKMLYVILCVVGTIACFWNVDRSFSCVIAFYYFAAALGTFLLLHIGSSSKVAQVLFIFHDYVMGAFFLGVILLLTMLYVPGKIQTWLLYNNALSRGVVIENILRASSGQDDDEDVHNLSKMKAIIVEQQNMIATLTSRATTAAVSHRGNDMITEEEEERGNDAGPSSQQQLHQTMSDNALCSLRENNSELGGSSTLADDVARTNSKPATAVLKSRRSESVGESINAATEN